MNRPTYFKTATILSLCGTLFAGYLSGYKFLTSTCAFNEPCPYVLGYPACWYGLAMFSAMFILALTGLLKHPVSNTLIKWITAVAFAGILFAGSLTWGELLPWLSGRTAKYSLVLPTCAYGLIFYVAIFAISAAMLTPKKPKL